MAENDLDKMQKNFQRFSGNFEKGVDLPVAIRKATGSNRTIPPSSLKGGYDETTWRNRSANMPSAIGSGMGASRITGTAPGPASLAAAEAAPAGRVQFGGTSPTIANTANGGVGLFGKDGRPIAPSDLVGKMGKIGNLGRDFSSQAAMDNQVFQMAMERAKDGTLPQGFFTGPGEPGAGNFGRDSMTMEFKNRRDQIQGKLDEFNRLNPLGKNASVGEIIAHQANTKSMRDEIRHIDEQIFGRTDLANKIMTALIGKDATLGAQALENQGKVDVQGLENQGIMDVWREREGQENKRHAASLLFGGKGDKKTDKGQDAYYDFIKGGLIKGLESRLAGGETLDVILKDMSPLARKNLGIGTNPLDIIE